MKLARFVHKDEDLWGVVDDDARKVQPIVGTIHDWGPRLTTGEGGVELAGNPVALDDVKLLPPITPQSTIIGLGMTYWSHLEKLGFTEKPANPAGFIKPQAAIIGPEDEMRYPPTTEQLDFEGELVAVIGLPVTPNLDRPSDAVLGYTIGNDTSARDAKSGVGGPDVFSSKALNQSSPVGPWIVTRDEFDDAPDVDLLLELRVNGEVRQHDRTGNMSFTLDEMLDYVVVRSSLTTGDLLLTGTTHGVGMEDGRFLVPGDVIEVEIEGIGVLRNAISPRP